MTPKEAYATDAVFRVLVDEWNEHRRCPRPLVDRCIDFGMHRAAECAQWAATEEDKVVFPNPATHHGERGGTCGPYPACNDTEAPEWVWCREDSIFRKYAFNVPSEYLKNDLAVYETSLEAILMLLEGCESET